MYHNPYKTKGVEEGVVTERKLVRNVYFWMIEHLMRSNKHTFNEHLESMWRDGRVNSSWPKLFSRIKTILFWPTFFLKKIKGFLTRILFRVVRPNRRSTWVFGWVRYDQSFLYFFLNSNSSSLSSIIRVIIILLISKLNIN
jgi:hypothetical protein